MTVQVGLCRTWSETPKTGFLTSRLSYTKAKDASEICTPSNHLIWVYTEILKSFPNLFHKILQQACWDEWRLNSCILSNQSCTWGLSNLLLLGQLETFKFDLSRSIRKPTLLHMWKKGADQRHSNHEGDQRLCFRYTDSAIPLLL